jgi:S-adenosylmethionine/arginine decarboxylase-like enzyme
MMSYRPDLLSRSTFESDAARLRALDDEFVAQYRAHEPWGLATAIDLAGCDGATIRDPQHIARFVEALCDAIAMRRFGAPIIVRFGADPRVCGYSLVQLIETSLVSGHFAEASDAAYLDIFSCAPYRPYQAAQLCATWFDAASASVSVTMRLAELRVSPRSEASEAATARRQRGSAGMM